MRVRFTQSIVGSGWGFNVGDVADLPEDQAFTLLRAGFAEIATDPAVIETATTKQPGETATIKTTTKRK